MLLKCVETLIIAKFVVTRSRMITSNEAIYKMALLSRKYYALHRHKINKRTVQVLDKMTYMLQESPHAEGNNKSGQKLQLYDYWLWDNKYINHWETSLI